MLRRVSRALSVASVIAIVIAAVGPTATASILYPGDSMHNGDTLYSDNASYYLTYSGSNGFYQLTSNLCAPYYWATSLDDGTGTYTCAGGYGQHNAQGR